MDAVKSRFAGGKLLSIRWNSLLQGHEFVVPKNPYITMAWKRLS